MNSIGHQQVYWRVIISSMGTCLTTTDKHAKSAQPVVGCCQASDQLSAHTVHSIAASLCGSQTISAMHAVDLVNLHRTCRTLSHAVTQGAPALLIQLLPELSEHREVKRYLDPVYDRDRKYVRAYSILLSYQRIRYSVPCSCVPRTRTLIGTSRRGKLRTCEARSI